MARCIDCAWFPWKPGADLSGLPAMRCHPELPMRRWGNAGTETACERYQAVDGDKVALAAEEQIVENKPDLEETPDITSGESPTIDETLAEPPTEGPEAQDEPAPETRTSDEVSEMPEEAPAATETRSGAKGKGKKGGSKQKKGD